MNCPDALPDTDTPPGQSAVNVPEIVVEVWFEMLHIRLPHDDGDGSDAVCVAHRPVIGVGLFEPPGVVGLSGLLE